MTRQGSFASFHLNFWLISVALTPGLDKSFLYFCHSYSRSHHQHERHNHHGSRHHRRPPPPPPHHQWKQFVRLSVVTSGFVGIQIILVFVLCSTVAWQNMPSQRTSCLHPFVNLQLTGSAWEDSVRKGTKEQLGSESSWSRISKLICTGWICLAVDPSPS